LSELKDLWARSDIWQTDYSDFIVQACGAQYVRGVGKVLVPYVIP